MKKPTSTGPLQRLVGQLREIAQCIDENKNGIIGDTLWLTDHETLYDALLRVSGELDALPYEHPTDVLQQKALDSGFQYWRASDAHGVTASKSVAELFIADLLGVEVEILPNSGIPSGPGIGSGQVSGLGGDK